MHARAGDPANVRDRAAGPGGTTMPCASARRSPTTRCLRSRRSCSSPPPSRAWSSAPRPSAGRSSASSISSSDAKARSPCRPSRGRQPTAGRHPRHRARQHRVRRRGHRRLPRAPGGAEHDLAREAQARCEPHGFLMDRLRSFGLVVAIGFLLMVSLAVTAALAALSGWLARLLAQHPARVERRQHARVARGDDGAVRPALSVSCPTCACAGAMSRPARS